MSLQPVHTACGHKSTGRKFSLDSKHPEHKGFFAGLMSLMGRKLSAGSARDVSGGGGSEDCSQRCVLKKLVQIGKALRNGDTTVALGVWTVNTTISENLENPAL